MDLRPTNITSWRARSRVFCWPSGFRAAIGFGNQSLHLNPQIENYNCLNILLELCMKNSTLNQN